MKNSPRYMSIRGKTTISALKAAKESLLESRKNILDRNCFLILSESNYLRFLHDISNNPSGDNKICTASCDVF
jgi:hypothetical protein